MKILKRLTIAQIKEIHQVGNCKKKYFSSKTKFILNKYLDGYCDLQQSLNFIYEVRNYYILPDGSFVKNHIESGAFGSYYKINSKSGIKIIHTDRPYTTIATLKKSRDWQKAKKEYNTQKKASKLSFVPKVYKLISVYNPHSNEYCPAILMEHIQGTHLDIYQNIKINNKTYRYEDDIEELSEYLNKYLKKVKIVHNDIHENNIIINRQKQLKLIDFGQSKIL